MHSFSNSVKPSTPYSVSALNRAVKYLLSDTFINIRVEGEISNLSMPSSGHIYFTLKDAQAQIRCALFRTRLTRVEFKAENGQQVIVNAQVSLYEPRGDYQLIVNTIEDAGAGALRRNFELLKQKLAAEGLFDSATKQALPTLPHCIGIITSPSGAAIRDILSVLKRRFAAIPVIIYPTSVQGESAKNEIMHALNLANQDARCDVIILARGGGSIEDLWAFNEETVARAIYNSAIPIIAGIGHESDITIADFVADLRAATPSAAAEHAAPDQQEWLQQFTRIGLRIEQLLLRQIKQLKQHLSWQEKRLTQQHPGQRLLQKAQTLDQLENRLQQAINNSVLRTQNRLKLQTARLEHCSPLTTIRRYQIQQDYLSSRLTAAISQQLHRYKQHLSNSSQTLNTLSPLATLDRGYAIVHPLNATTIIQNSQQLSLDDLIETRFAQGKIISQVKDITL